MKKYFIILFLLQILICSTVSADPRKSEHFQIKNYSGQAIMIKAEFWENQAGRQNLGAKVVRNGRGKTNIMGIVYTRTGGKVKRGLDKPR
jgi:hypothetical protein